MPLNLPEMVGEWEIIPRQIDLVMAGNRQCADANPKRLALGFSHFGSLSAWVFPLTSVRVEWRIPFIGTHIEWLYWQMHGPIVALPWIFSTPTPAGDSITVLEVYQAGSKK